MPEARAFAERGALPRATVALAVTPDTLEALREEAGALLDEIEGQAGCPAIESSSVPAHGSCSVTRSTQEAAMAATPA